MSGRLALRNAQARRDARLLLTPLSQPNSHRDQWRIDRARWLYQYSSRTLALKELADTNAYRDVRRWNQQSTEPDLPRSVLAERVGTPLSSAEGGDSL